MSSLSSAPISQVLAGAAAETRMKLGGSFLRARTEVSRRDGWLVERLDAWGPDGAHLGVGEQLRVMCARKEHT